MKKQEQNLDEFVQKVPPLPSRRLCFDKFIIRTRCTSKETRLSLKNQKIKKHLFWSFDLSLPTPLFLWIRASKTLLIVVKHLKPVRIPRVSVGSLSANPPLFLGVMGNHHSKFREKIRDFLIFYRQQHRLSSSEERAETRNAKEKSAYLPWMSHPPFEYSMYRMSQNSLVKSGRKTQILRPQKQNPPEKYTTESTEFPFRGRRIRRCGAGGGKRASNSAAVHLPVDFGFEISFLMSAFPFLRVLLFAFVKKRRILTFVCNDSFLPYFR